jgi:hypothetical protein
MPLARVISDALMLPCGLAFLDRASFVTGREGNKEAGPTLLRTLIKPSWASGPGETGLAIMQPFTENSLYAARNRLQLPV